MDGATQHWLSRGSVPHRVWVRTFDSGEEDLLHEARALRTSVYLARGLLTHQELVGGIDACSFDERAVHIGVHDPDGHLVATARVILGSPERPIPVAGAPFHVTPERAHGEISRYVVAPGWNGLGLAPAIWREIVRIAADLDLRDLYAEIEGFLLDSLHAVGLPFIVLGEPNWVYNAPNYPVLLRMDSLIDDLLPRNPALAAFLMDQGRERVADFHPSDLRVSPADLLVFHGWWDTLARSR